MSGEERSKRFWRLVFEYRKVYWFGPCHTYQLWPPYIKADRANW